MTEHVLVRFVSKPISPNMSPSLRLVIGTSFRIISYSTVRDDTYLDGLGFANYINF